MSHIIQDFRNWKKVNEDDDTPGRERQRGRGGNKIVAIPIDKNTLKIKIVKDADVIDNNDKLTIEGFDAIINWIKGQGEIIGYYDGLNNLIDNVVVYDINRDTDTRQIITFKIYSKASLQKTDPTSVGINSQVRFLKSNELNLALKGSLLNTRTISAITSGQDAKAAGFTMPFAASSIIDSTNEKLIKFIGLAYNTIGKDTKAKASPLMAKVKEEALAKKLGKMSKLFIYALNSGFGIADDDFPEDIETDITKTLYDKITYADANFKKTSESNRLYLDLSADRIVEAISDVIAGFDVDTFLAVAKTMKPDTGDIKVPDGGFTEGMKANAELAKFQLLLYNTFKAHKGYVDYANFASAKGDGKAGKPVGDYGKTTVDMVRYAKAACENPVWPERDGKTISVEFVKRIQNEAKGIKESFIPKESKGEKIYESRTYLGLDGNSIVNEDLNPPPGAAKVQAAAPAAKPKPKATATTTSTSSNLPSTGEITYPNDPGWKYKLINGVWHCKEDSDTSWFVLTNPSWVKKLITFTGQGNYINVQKSGNAYNRTDTNVYNYKDGAWKVLMNNSWTTVPDSTFLVNLYGSNPTSTTSTVASLQAENKRIMDLIYAYATDKKEVDKGTWKTGSMYRDIQFHFQPSSHSGYFKDYWNITFYENGDGTSRKSTFSVYDNYNDKVIYRGYLEDFSGGMFKLRTTSGAVLATFNDTLANILKRLCNVREIFWYS